MSLQERPMAGQDRPLGPSRFWEIDALRGVAILCMIAFHLTWDLILYGWMRVNMSRGPWPWFSRIIATTFLLLSGASLVISSSKGDGKPGFRKVLLRGLKVFGFGLLISLITYIGFGDDFVVFGILHLIGFSIVAAYPFLAYKRRWISLALGIVLLIVGSYLNRETVLHPWFIPFGVNERGRAMLDWYPVLPWFGMMLIGLWIGHTLYRDGRRRFALPDGSGLPAIRQLAFLGRHALLIYMVHQPILVGILLAVGWVLSRQ